MPSGPPSTRDKAPALLHRVAAVLRRVIGAPDYDVYVHHVQTCHPGVTPMPRAEFERSRLEQRYSRPGQRCC